MAGKEKNKEKVFKIDTDGMTFEEMVRRVAKGGDPKPSDKGKRMKKEGK